MQEVIFNVFCMDWNKQNTIVTFIVLALGNENLLDEETQDLEPTEPQSQAEAKGYVLNI